MAAPLTLKHADGTAVTAQEAYDAFMNTRVLISMSSGITHEVICMDWYDNNSAHDDPANVGYVELRFISKVDNNALVNSTKVGDSSLVPAQQG